MSVEREGREREETISSRSWFQRIPFDLHTVCDASLCVLSFTGIYLYGEWMCLAWKIGRSLYYSLCASSIQCVRCALRGRLSAHYYCANKPAADDEAAASREAHSMLFGQTEIGFPMLWEYISIYLQSNIKRETCAFPCQTLLTSYLLRHHHNEPKGGTFNAAHPGNLGCFRL